MTDYAFTLERFIAESNRIEGIHRSPFASEIKAHEQFSVLSTVDVNDLELFVTSVQPHANLRRHAGMNVRVGDHIPPKGGPAIEERLKALLEIATREDASNRRRLAYWVHCRYETLHPFTDGNGRSGRALWLWMMGGINRAPLGFLHHFYYQTLAALDERRPPEPLGGQSPDLSHTHHTPPSPCPYCKEPLDRAAGPEKIKPGDVSVCFGCRNILVFTDGHGLRKPTDDELVALATDPVIKAMVAAVSEVKGEGIGEKQ